MTIQTIEDLEFLSPAFHALKPITLHPVSPSPLLLGYVLDKVTINIPVIVFKDLILFLIKLDQHGVCQMRYYAQEIIPYDPNYEIYWDFTTVLNGEYITTYGDHPENSEMLVFYIEDMDHYVMIQQATHRGILL